VCLGGGDVASLFGGNDAASEDATNQVLPVDVFNAQFNHAVVDEYLIVFGQ
jgi:hypothetical protein